LKLSIKYADKREQSLFKEWNLDNISMDIIFKLFGGAEETDWRYFSGILVAFIALSINSDSKSLLNDTDHPSIRSRYKNAKSLIFKMLK